MAYTRAKRSCFCYYCCCSSLLWSQNTKAQNKNKRKTVHIWLKNWKGITATYTPNHLKSTEQTGIKLCYKIHIILIYIENAPQFLHVLQLYVHLLLLLMVFAAMFFGVYSYLFRCCCCFGFCCLIFIFLPSLNAMFLVPFFVCLLRRLFCVLCAAFMCVRHGQTPSIVVAAF